MFGLTHNLHLRPFIRLLIVDTLHIRGRKAVRRGSEGGQKGVRRGSGMVGLTHNLPRPGRQCLPSTALSQASALHI
eukprot:740346-Prorocentrum_minimum.AAC.1